MPLLAVCAGVAALDVSATLIGNWLGGRKTTLDDVVGSAASGCVAGLVGLGIGKLLSSLFKPGVKAPGAGLGNLSRAGEFGIWPYGKLSKDLAGMGLEAHLFPKRFASVLGQQVSQMAFHRAHTRRAQCLYASMENSHTLRNHGDSNASDDRASGSTDLCRLPGYPARAGIVTSHGSHPQACPESDRVRCC